jgi:nucleotide-binding universal stress UspA family protein
MAMVSTSDDRSEPAPAFGAPRAGATRVLLATDGSEASIAAARVAATMFPDGEIVLVTVIDELQDPMADAGGFEGPAMNEKDAAEEYREENVDAQGALAATAHVFGARAVPQRVIEHRGEGRGARLCAYAADEGAELLVLGSHGHGVLADVLLGSISNHVVHHSTVPVLVVPTRK